jgi:general stress protein YciG
LGRNPYTRNWQTNMSPEQMSEVGRRGARALPHEARSRGGRKGGRKTGRRNMLASIKAGNHVNQRKRKCRHCDRVTNLPNASRHERACARS